MHGGASGSGAPTTTLREALAVRSARAAHHLPTAGHWANEARRLMYVPLTVEEFHRGYAVIMATSTGRLQPPPMTDLPIDLDTGQPIDLPDTPLNRA